MNTRLIYNIDDMDAEDVANMTPSTAEMSMDKMADLFMFMIKRDEQPELAMILNPSDEEIMDGDIIRGLRLRLFNDACLVGTIEE